MNHPVKQVFDNEFKLIYAIVTVLIYNLLTTLS